MGSDHSVVLASQDPKFSLKALGLLSVQQNLLQVESNSQASLVLGDERLFHEISPEVIQSW
jgi:hypothetical protein